MQRACRMYRPFWEGAKHEWGYVDKMNNALSDHGSGLIGMWALCLWWVVASLISR